MTALDPDAAPFTYIPLDELTTPRSGRVVVDGWWAVHPERGAVVFRGSPQYNTDQRITQQVRVDLYPWAEIRLIPLAFMAAHDQRVEESK